MASNYNVVKPVVVKPAFFMKSKRIWGFILLAAPFFSELLDINISEDAVTGAATAVDTIVKSTSGLLGSILTLWGAFTKKFRAITVSPAEPPVEAEVEAVVTK